MLRDRGTFSRWVDRSKGLITGQTPDGGGEGMDLERIRADDSKLYVHLGTSDDWNIQTEQKRVGPKIAEGFPQLRFSTLMTSVRIICSKRGENGKDICTRYNITWGDQVRDVGGGEVELSVECVEFLKIRTAYWINF